MSSGILEYPASNKLKQSFRFYLIPLLLLTTIPSGVYADPIALRTDITVTKVLDTKTVSHSVRLARINATDSQFLYYLKLSGEIYKVNLTAGTKVRVYTSAHHQLTSTEGMAVGSSGVIYLVGNEDLPNSLTRAKIVKGVIDPITKKRAWSVLAETEGYPKSNTAFDHRFNGIVVSPQDDFVYVNSGARTDHGEIQTAGGLFPKTREVGITACILRLPTGGNNIVLPNNRTLLRSAGYIFAEGTRNTFDMAFAPNGDLFGAENAPDRDMPEELNWLRFNKHYGFPWRIGGQDNPQQFADYDPTLDLLLNPRFTAVKNGYYQNDPTFPKRPVRQLTEPVINLGPDADSYRDPVDGLIKDASQLGIQFSTFTSHRSPLGLVFDRSGVMSPEFQGDGFMLSWTAGDPLGDSVAGPFLDPSQDLLDLKLTKIGQGNYQLHATRVVGGFNHPIDAEVIGNTIYVLEYGGTQGLWKVTMPPKSP